MIAASFSQTYLRNAYNNGFLCIEVPGLVSACVSLSWLKSARKKKRSFLAMNSQSTLLPARWHWRGESFVFPPLGGVPQSLVIAGGAENAVAKKLGLSTNTDRKKPSFQETKQSWQNIP